MTISIPRTTGASPEAIRKLTARFGPLPEDYVQFLHNHDGARPPDNVLEGSGDNVGVQCFIPAAEISSDVDRTEAFPKMLMPVADDGLGNFICIRLGDHKIYFLDRDDHYNSSVVAADFSSFINLLVPFEDSKIEHLKGQATFVWVHPKLKSGEIK